MQRLAIINRHFKLSQFSFLCWYLQIKTVENYLFRWIQGIGIIWSPQNQGLIIRNEKKWLSSRQARMSGHFPRTQIIHMAFVLLSICICLSFETQHLGLFPVSWFFASGSQGIRALASVLLMNTQGWFPSGSTAWISLLSRGLSRVFSNTTIWKHQFFGAQPSFYDLALTSTHDYWKNHSFD